MGFLSSLPAPLCCWPVLPGRRQDLRAGQQLGEGLPLMGKLLTNGQEPQYWADAHLDSHCWINGNISTTA